MEDIFTLVDLSANTGHHLGTAYSAADLRVVRRSITVRVIRMLSQAYARRQKNPDTHWRMLERLFERFDAQTTAEFSMNWDMVFERGVARSRTIRQIDYGCHAAPVSFDKGRLSPRRLGGDTLHILKPRGSVNWLYCDACRETFWVGPSDTEQFAQTLFSKGD